MKRLMYFTMILCALCVAVTSCSDKNDSKDSKADNELVGKWKQVIETEWAKTITTYDFRDNGTVTQTLVTKSESPLIDIKGDAEFEYKYDDDVITFKLSGKDVQFSKFEIEGLPEDMAGVMMEQMKSQMVDMEQKYTDVKIKGDKLTAKFQGVEITMTRM